MVSIGHIVVSYIKLRKHKDYTAQSSPVLDLEILLEVNPNFQVRLTIILTCGVFSRAMLKYNDSNPSLLKLFLLSLIDKSIKNSSVSFLSFYKLFWCLLKLSLAATITYSITARQVYGSEIFSAK